MGLDMNLYKKSYVKNWNFMTPEERHEIIVKKNGKIREDIQPERISEIVEEVAYWRKFNALHKWFVDNCQDGNDDCRESYIPRKSLENLLEKLKRIDADNSLAETLLPSQPGFFFGGIEYDEWYFQDVKETIDTLDALLKEGDHRDFYYRSSW